jgi:peptidyl-tRNA hydrolase ICT1
LRLQSLQSDTDHSVARNWLDGFRVDDIPKDAWEAGYSRSSGPGGQASGVTKATENVADI